MAELERRVDALEERVDDLYDDVPQVAAVGAATSRDAVQALEAHRHNTRLLNALRVTQAEHSRAHDEHRARFDVMDARFDTVDARLDAVERTLGRVTVGMHTIESLLRRALDDEGC